MNPARSSKPEGRHGARRLIAALTLAMPVALAGVVLPVGARPAQATAEPTPAVGSPAAIVVESAN